MSGQRIKRTRDLPAQQHGHCISCLDYGNGEQIISMTRQAAQRERKTLNRQDGRGSAFIALLDRIHCGHNVEVMRELPDDSIDVVVTSPPFNCGKNYGIANDQRPWAKYWDDTREWLTELVRVMAPGSRACINLPWWMGKKPRRDAPYQFKTLASECGLLMLDKVIWVKGDSTNVHTSGGWGGNGSGWGTYMSPSGPAIRCASEPILIFVKGTRGRGRINGKGNGQCIRGDMTKEEWMAWTLDVWFVRGASHPKHPAVFPCEIPTRLIKLYTFPGEIVLDPFCGIGTTCRAAKSLGRRFVGIDLNEEYCAEARASVAV